MDPLTSLALVGTARQTGPTAKSGSPVDAILESLADVPAERRVLLAAGVRAVAAMAGRRALRSEEAVTVSPPERLPACSAKAARIIGDLLRENQSELLHEALVLLTRAGQRLPHSSLPETLRVRTGELRSAANPVLGERGAWLARMNESWDWVAAAPAAASLEELEQAWTDGTAAARRGLLVHARQVDAARARAWLEATWSSEKADERAALLAGLRTGISSADEAFLEAQLRDRAVSVRETAQSILAHLPESAFVRRMTVRADAMLQYKRSVLSFAGKRGTLAVNPPETVDDAAERDGLGKPPQGTGARAFWLTRILAAVPVGHWTSGFKASPAELCAAAESSEWASAVCEGWTRAAVVHGDAEWLGALWEFFQRSSDKSVASPVAGLMTLTILRAMTPTAAAASLEPLFGNTPSRIDLGAALASLATPWPESVGKRWVDAVRADLTGGAVPRFLETLPRAALALPAACFASAIELLEFTQRDPPLGGRALIQFVDTIRIRNDLFQEINP